MPSETTSTASPLEFEVLVLSELILFLWFLSLRFPIHDSNDLSDFLGLKHIYAYKFLQN